VARPSGPLCSAHSRREYLGFTPLQTPLGPKSITHSAAQVGQSALGRRRSQWSQRSAPQSDVAEILQHRKSCTRRDSTASRFRSPRRLCEGAVPPGTG
jgi:hypothetical protein